MDLNTTNESKTKLLPISEYYKENCKNFLKETSLKGLKYIEDARRSIWERFYYLIAFSVAFSASLCMTIYFFQKWQSIPVLFSLNTRATSIQEIPFPAVTFCNMNQALASKVVDIQKDSPDYAMLQKICFQDYNYTQFKNFKPRFEGDTLVNFNLKNSQSCDDMIIYCKYGPNEENCSDLFREVFLDEGLCCVFNQLHPFYLYKGEYEFVRDFTSSKGRTRVPVNWNLEDGYQKDLPKDYYPRRAIGSGVSLGLTVVLNADIDEYYCSSTNGAGFKTLLYNPIASPAIKESGLPIMLGHQNRIHINTKLIESLPSLRTKVQPKERKCYFSWEKELLYFKYYTRRSCEMECNSRQMLRRCNCVSHHLPKLYKNTSRCFLSDMECVAKTERLILDPINLKCKEACLPNCHELAFYPDIFVSPLATGDRFLRNISKEMMENNLALVHIYYSNTFFRGTIKMPYMGLTEFLSQTGGILSLMVGFSVISIAEMFFFIFLKPFIDMLLKRNPRLLNSKDNTKKEDSSKDIVRQTRMFKRRKNLDELDDSGSEKF